MKLISCILFYFVNAYVSLSQNEFYNRVEELFFNIPREAGISEIEGLVKSDSTLSNVRSVTDGKLCFQIYANFLYNPFLNNIRDTATVVFSFGEHEGFFRSRCVIMKYKHAERKECENQFNSLIDYFNEVSYTNEKMLIDGLPTLEQYYFYNDSYALSQEYPKVILNYGTFPAHRDVEERYRIQICFVEEIKE